jgi:polyisoprenoid-binding protein YceI
MQKHFLILTSLAIFTCSACDNVAKGTKVQATTAAETTATANFNFKIDAAASTLKWEGTKPTGKHTGTIALKEGALAAENGVLTGGVFTIDMNAINCTDLTEKDGKADLEAHLKSADFFDVAKFAGAKFEITKVSAIDGEPNATITGNLTLKDVTKSISFQATVREENGVLKADAIPFVLNRTDFGIKTGSKSLASTAKDKIIGDDIGLTIHLEAKK